MWQNVQLWSFVLQFFWKSILLTSTDLIVIYVEFVRVAPTEAFCFASVVMIKNAGKVSQNLSESTIVHSHLEKHVHLTNCIHLKHQVHMQKPRMVAELQLPSELALVRELSALQKSRSLRDPSTSPSWQSMGLGSLLKKLNKESEMDGRGEQLPGSNESRRALRKFVTVAASLGDGAGKKGDANVDTVHNGGSAQQDLSGEEGWVEIRPGEYSQIETRSHHSEAKATTNRHLFGQGGDYSTRHHVGDATKAVLDWRLPKITSESREQVDSRISDRYQSSYNQYNDILTGSLERTLADSMSYTSRKGKRQEVESSQRYFRSARKGVDSGYRRGPNEPSSSREDGADTGYFDDVIGRSPNFGSDSILHSKYSTRNVARLRKRKVQRAKKSRLQQSIQLLSPHPEGWDNKVVSCPRNGNVLRSSIIASDMDDSPIAGENDELDIYELPQNGCGIPWNWSRIHTRGKNMLDLAGRSLSCGVSDPRSRKSGNTMFRSDPSSCRESLAATASDKSDTSFDTESESLPLLVEPTTPLQSGSVSERGLEDGSSSRKQVHGAFPKQGRTMGHTEISEFFPTEDRLHSISQKYMPGFFNEIIGQNLVTQALSNALLRGKIAPVYIFHGPRGTGKTSCATVFALALNCQSLEEPKPCGACMECLAHNSRKTSIVKEVNAAGNNAVRRIKSLIHDVSRSPFSRYTVIIVDECQCLSSQSWNAFLEVLEGIPRNVVFILSTSSLERLPHSVVSRCQKFLFSKIRESEITHRLQAIVIKENLDADTDAIKLIASTSDGSVRDGEMMLDQLSLLGQKITLSMVQELVGLIPDGKLVDLLDFALSADTVNTVRSLRELIDSGIDALTLISQLAALITSILAGGYKLPEGHKRKFFRKNELTKEGMERLRQALKMLSEAEKQLRSSSDRTTWLTAALLQFAPDHSYLLPSSSGDTSVTQSPLIPNNANEMAELECSRKNQMECQRLLEVGTVDANKGAVAKYSEARKHGHQHSESPQSKHTVRDLKVHEGNGHMVVASTTLYDNHVEAHMWPATVRRTNDLEDIWQKVLDGVHSNSLRQFLQAHGKLISLSIAKAFVMAHLEFSQPDHLARSERSRMSIAHAFQVTLGYQVEVKATLASTKEDQRMKQTISGHHPSIVKNLQRPSSVAVDGRTHSGEMVADGHLQLIQGAIIPKGMDRILHESLDIRGIVPSHVPESQTVAQKASQSLEIVVFGNGKNHGQKGGIKSPSNEEKLESAWAQEVRVSPHHYMGGTYQIDKHWDSTKFRSNSGGNNKLSLGFVIQQAEGSVEGYSQDLKFEHENEALSRKQLRNRGPEVFFSNPQEEASIMAAKLEEENLRMESKSRGLLCWKTTERRHGKVKKHRGNQRRGILMRLVPCAKSKHS